MKKTGMSDPSECPSSETVPAATSSAATNFSGILQKRISDEAERDTVEAAPKSLLSANKKRRPTKGSPEQSTNPPLSSPSDEGIRKAKGSGARTWRPNPNASNFVPRFAAFKDEWDDADDKAQVDAFFGYPQSSSTTFPVAPDIADQRAVTSTSSIGKTTSRGSRRNSSNLEAEARDKTTAKKPSSAGKAGPAGKLRPQGKPVLTGKNGSKTESTGRKASTEKSDTGRPCSGKKPLSAAKETAEEDKSRVSERPQPSSAGQTLRAGNSTASNLFQNNATLDAASVQPNINQAQPNINRVQPNINQIFGPQMPPIIVLNPFKKEVVPAERLHIEPSGVASIKSAPGEGVNVGSHVTGASTVNQHFGGATSSSSAIRTPLVVPDANNGHLTGQPEAWNPNQEWGNFQRDDRQWMQYGGMQSQDWGGGPPHRMKRMRPGNQMSQASSMADMESQPERPSRKKKKYTYPC